MKIDVYTDGSCSRNPGVGGYSAILRCGGLERIVKGNVPMVTTNNAMELKAVVETIVWVNTHQKKPCVINIYTDSQYIIDCACGKQKDGSKRLVGWFKGRSNEDLWMQLINQTILGKHEIHFFKVKGHSGDALNERANTIAQSECQKAKTKFYSGGQKNG